MRKELGHVFQGRYQAIVLEDGAALGAVCHYIHLNPARAGAVARENLARYRHGSFHWLRQAKKRPAFPNFSTALETAGDLMDTPAGRRSYFEYLSWLAADEPARKAMSFEDMCRRWARDSTGFKKALVREHKEKKLHRAAFEAETAELRELVWEECVQQCLRKLRCEHAEVTATRKAAAWKVAIAVHSIALDSIDRLLLG